MAQLRIDLNPQVYRAVQRAAAKRGISMGEFAISVLHNQVSDDLRREDTSTTQCSLCNQDGHTWKKCPMQRRLFGE